MKTVPRHQYMARPQVADVEGGIGGQPIRGRPAAGVWTRGYNPSH